jgi:chemosensory pili system protein ChpC
MTDPQRDVRAVLIAVTGGSLLLPNASVSEVITFPTAEPYPDQPFWLYGRIRWRGWRIPLFSYAKMLGWAEEESQIGARVAVLKALSGHARLPFMALMTQGFPRLTTVNESELREEGDNTKTDGILARVRVREDVAAIPDLSMIESQLMIYTSA